MIKLHFKLGNALRYQNGSMVTVLYLCKSTYKGVPKAHGCRTDLT
jgi:hypothetical protein